MSKESNKVLVDINFLHKIADFIKVSTSEIVRLQKVAEQSLQKEAADNETKSRYKQSVMKVATALYDSDFDFVTGDFDHRQFVKLAMEDPSYLARKFEQVCNAADVSLIGKPARVAAVTKHAELNDPVYTRAFGVQNRNIRDIVDWED